ncbi:hypothetical protein KC957_03395, partial [Candidatus Saccharibacteria bacterium]|nr:hypothetical protein [Candidatus Saccharibacteria bacterium]
MIVRKIGLAVVFAAVILLLTVAMNAIIIPNVAFTDYYPIHDGCNWMYQGISPYEESVTADFQAKVYAIVPTYDPAIDAYRFPYPAHICLILSPILILPYEVAAPLWMAVNLLLLLTLPLVFVKEVAGRSLSISMMLTLTVLTLFGWRYSLILVVLGQFTGLILAAAVLAIWALLRQRTWILSFAILILVLRPESAALAIILLLFALRDRQFRVLYQVAVLLGVAYIVASLFAGFQWPLDFVMRIFEYATNRTRASTWLPTLYGLPSVLLSLLLAGAAIVLYAKALPRLSREESIIWGSALSILFVLLFVPQTNSYTLVYTLPVIYLLMISRNSMLRSYILVVTLIAPWVYASLKQFPQGTDQLLFPLLLLGGFALYAY